MIADDWTTDFARTVGVYLNGDAIPSRGPRGDRVVDDSFFILFNAHDGRIDFTLPDGDFGGVWRMLLDTSHSQPGPSRRYKSGARARVQPRSIVLLRREQ